MLVYLSIPFILLLAAIALMPFIHRHWWEQHYGKASIMLAAVVGGHAAPMLAAPKTCTWLSQAPAGMAKSTQSTACTLVSIAAIS